MEVGHILGRNTNLFTEDYKMLLPKMAQEVQKAKFLVIGGAGSIGQAVVLEILKLAPKILHVVDISENELVELVRVVRSSMDDVGGEFKTFCLDFGGPEFGALLKSEKNYDYIFNLSALKHVRSERDPYTLMRMVKVNILNTVNSVKLAREVGASNYFCVSTDKAANPANMMGASKKIMEMFLNRESLYQHITMARFANVAFSNGSLLHGFLKRFEKLQPLSAPNDIERYFIKPEEAGQLCLLSGLTGENMDIYFPKLDVDVDQHKFSDLAVRFLEEKGYEPFVCGSEQEARDLAAEYIPKGRWPCYFFSSTTSGEKKYEEFFTPSEVVNFSRFETIGVIKNTTKVSEDVLDYFSAKIHSLLREGSWSKSDLLELFESTVQSFDHIETGTNLDQKM